MKRINKIQNRPRLVALAAILCVAAVLRFWYLDAIEHNIDHAYPVYQALQTLEQGTLPLAGQETSVLFANPALTGYLYVPALLLWRSPVAAYLLVIALNTLAVWLLYRAVAALLDEEHALIAAALMAVNPWIVEYSRATWVQGLVPFFTCLLAYWLFPVLVGKSARPGRDTIAALVSLTLLTQTYLPAFVVVLPVGVLLAIYRKRVPWRSVMVGGAVFAVASGVYGAGLLVDWERTSARVDGFLHGENESETGLSIEAWEHAARLVSGAEYANARGTEAPIRDADRRQALSDVASAALGLAILAGAVLPLARANEYLFTWGFAPDPTRGLRPLDPFPGAALPRKCRSRTAKSWWGRGGKAPTESKVNRYANDKQGHVIALAWVIVPLIPMSWVSRPVHPFYLLVTLPGGCALAAMGLGWLLRWRRAGTSLLVAGGVALALLSGTNSARYYQETRAIPGAHALSALPLGDGLRLGDTINEMLAGQPERFLSIDEDPMIISSLCGRITAVSRDQRFPALTRVVPWAGGVVATFDAGDSPPAPVGAELAGSIDLHDGTAIRFYRHARGGSDSAWLNGAHRVDWPTDRGITLAGWAWEAEGYLLTYWRVDALPPDYGAWLLGPAVHAFDAEGARVAVYGGEAVPGHDWRVGQLYIQRVAIPGGASSSAAYFDVSLYDAGRGQGAVFLPGGGEAMAAYRIEK